MKSIILSMALVPCILFADMSALKKDIEIKANETLIYLSKDNTYKVHMFLCGRHQAFLEVLEMIEEFESGKKEERN